MDSREEIFDELYRCKANFETKSAYCAATKPIELHKWNGRHPVEENEEIVTVLPGSTLKIVMVSRFGDCGLTDDLEAKNGYGTRVDIDSPLITNVRWEQ